LKSSTILKKSHDIFKNIRNLYPGGKIPNFIKEIPQFGKCIYYIERHAKDSHLIFKTKNIDRWNRSLEILKIIMNILMETNTGMKKKIKIEFEEIDNINEPINFGDNSKNFFANILISGGVDSLCGAYHYIKQLQKKIVFTHTNHRNTPSISMIRNFIKDLDMPLIEVDGLFKNEAKFRHISGKDKETKMNLNQTRTFFYLCNAIPINYVYGIDKIFITENGPLTINPPFTESYEFTNTTNPEFIDFFNTFLNHYFGQKNLIKIKLPFRDYTKAELMASVPNELLIKTHSCSKFYNKKKSCLNCYACYIRKLSSYAYENYYDDNYNPEGTILNRYAYNEKDYVFNKEISFFKEKPENNFFIELMDFCVRTLDREDETLYADYYPNVFGKFLKINNYYNDFWDILKRYSEDLLTGIQRFFNKKPSLKNTNNFVWNHFHNEINKLITKGILPKDFIKSIKRRILERSNSIVGDLRG